MPVSPDKDPYYRLRHSAAHVMAEAVLEEFPEGKIAIGPPIEDGFYYDFDLPRSLTPEDLVAIEEPRVELGRWVASVVLLNGDGRVITQKKIDIGPRRRGARAIPGPALQARADRWPGARAG